MVLSTEQQNSSTDEHLQGEDETAIAHESEQPVAIPDGTDARLTTVEAPELNTLAAPDSTSNPEKSLDKGDTRPLTHEPDTAPEERDVSLETHQLTPHHVPTVNNRASRQGLAAAVLRDVGRVRAMNQDNAISLLTVIPREADDLPLGLFLVADGMGGHQGGEIASQLAVASVVRYVLGHLLLPALEDDMSEPIQSLMEAAVQEANHVIWQQARMTGSDMGTTCTVVLMLGHTLYIGHVGDSRAYLLEHGLLRKLTTDHSTIERLIQLGQLDPADAHTHALRNQLYRTVGQQPDVQVDFLYQPIGESTHLLLCSDGLWGMVSDSQIAQALKTNPWPEDACRELIALANLGGGEDNISAVVVSLPVTERQNG